jgi:TonB family protein
LAFHRSHRRGLGGALTLAAALSLGPACARAQAPEPTAEPQDPPPVQADAPAAISTTAVSKVRSLKVLRRPTDAETADLYPADARKHAKQGQAVVTCEIGLSTRLENCAVTSEDPPGFGFGAALLKATPYYRIQPPAVNGEPVPHVKITIPMRFEFNLDKAVEQLPPARPQASAGAAEPPRETAAERLKRLGPLRRSDDVLWAPLALAGYALAGIAWALFAPLQTRRRKPRRIPGHLA